MDKFSDFIPIVIGVIIFIVKIVSDANKKQQQQNQPKRNPDSVQRNPYQYGDKPETREQNNDLSWEQSRTEENDYRSVDPGMVPKDLPDIDYDKISNASVETSQNEIITMKIERIESKKLRDIRKLFKDKASIQELMLLSEVLNKPKALRKW
jgi:hypothetical protein